MNVITIMNDTFRRDHVGAYGLEAPWANPGTGHGRIHTPNLDDLARQSVRFDRFYAGSYPTIPHPLRSLERTILDSRRVPGSRWRRTTER